MRWNKLCVWLVSCFLCLWVTEGVAQDVVPVKSRPDRHSGHVSDSKAMQQLLKFIQVSNPMPASFRETTENRIEDPTGELLPFWQKLSVLDRPLRIVHLVTRTCGDMCFRMWPAGNWKMISDGKRYSICR